MDTFVIKPLDVKDPPTIGRVLSLQRAAYAVEAELIGFDGIPPLHDNPETLLACHETFYGCFTGGELAGLIAFTLDTGTLDVCRMAVCPRFFRRGVASRLLEFVEAVPGIDRMVVSTGKGNDPAVSLYLKHGFKRVGEREVAEGVFITLFEKEI
jgi:ribosomal protein S18 acetylase RimI-like enzyme